MGVKDSVGGNSIVAISVVSVFLMFRTITPGRGAMPVIRLPTIFGDQTPIGTEVDASNIAIAPYKFKKKRSAVLLNPPGSPPNLCGALVWLTNFPDRASHVLTEQSLSKARTRLPSGRKQ